MEEEIKFPIKIEKCPNCKGTRFVAQEVLESERKKGRIGKGITVAYLYRHQSIIVDPAQVMLSVPVIVTLFDACASCGTVVCIYAEIKTSTPGLTK